MKTWRIEVKPSAEKQYLKLDKKMRQRIKGALRDLEREEKTFFHPGVRPLSGELKGDFRMRGGGFRVLFTPDNETRVLHVYAILPRGDAY